MAFPSCATLLRCGQSSTKRRMTTRQQLRLSYWRKWKDFGRFPWKLVLHVLLLCASTTQVCNAVARPEWARALTPPRAAALPPPAPPRATDRIH